MSHKWKNRVLLVETPSYKHQKYIQIKKIYEDNLKDFHKRYIKFITKICPQCQIKIFLIGFDGNIKKKFTQLVPKNIYQLVDKMPLGKLMKNNPRITPKNLSLYSDYNKQTTTPGLGYKNAEKAKYTVKIIQNRPIAYQKQVLNTMIGRAKNHPHKTSAMMEAIEIFSKRLNNL